MLKAKVTATVTIEVEVGLFHTNCTFDSLNAQCKTEALQQIHNKLNNVKIIGCPKINVIILEET